MGDGKVAPEQSAVERLTDPLLKIQIGARFQNNKKDLFAEQLRKGGKNDWCRRIRNRIVNIGMVALKGRKGLHAKWDEERNEEEKVGEEWPKILRKPVAEKRTLEVIKSFGRKEDKECFRKGQIRGLAKNNDEREEEKETLVAYGKRLDMVGLGGMQAFRGIVIIQIQWHWHKTRGMGGLRELSHFSGMA